MERMDDVEEMLREMSEKYKNSKSVEVYEEQLEGWFKIIDDLREENKKLKEERDNCLKEVKLCYNDIHSLEGQISDLEEENNRLKNNAMEDMRVQTKLEDRIKELEQCNLNLQTWLDNKEKVNKSLREELEKLKSTYVYDAKQVRDIC